MTQEEFNKLIDKYLSGQASKTEQRLIDDFFKAQEKKQTLHHYKLSEEMWTSIENRIHRISEPAAENLREGISSPKRTVKKYSFRRVMVPVVVLIALALSGWYAFQRGMFETNQASDRITSLAPRGQKSIITLSDGSRVYLNSGSSIAHPAVFERGKREIELSGEAFFEVTPDGKRPFIIHSGNLTTRVLGTSFNIRAFDKNEISVTVATGKVQLEINDTLSHRSAERLSVPVMLFPNQQAVYKTGTGIVTSEVQVEQFIAWKNNTLYFEGTSLEDAAVMLERWYNVTIDFANEDIRQCKIYGQYRDQTLMEVLGSIRYMYQIDYRFDEENKIELNGKGCK
jgi:transmembrane sensor